MSKSNFSDYIIDHVIASGCDDVLSKPFFCNRWDEDLLSDENWKDFLRGEIGVAITQNPVSIGSLCNIAVPKGRYTFRTISHMSLVDTLKYTALVFKIGRIIEENRLSKSVVFSNRFNYRNLTLDRSNYDRFLQESKKLSGSKKYKVKIITDISNFYDRLNIHKLENILNEKGCDRTVVSKLNDILLRWSQQQSFGLPVGSDASRLLAEAMLINADKELSLHRIKFIRYVDDYRIFCKSQTKAYEAMQILDWSLRREGLFLNSGKTKLIDLEQEIEEKEEGKNEFVPINIDEKIERTSIIKTRYASRIAKYYRFPGKEAVEKLRLVNLGDSYKKIIDPKISEDSLKDFIKAIIYSENPSFEWLAKTIDIYPHLIPYVVDAIVKENEKEETRFDANFHRKAIKKFRDIFKIYSKNHYFRIQACRLLCAIDPNCGEFLSMELIKFKSGEEIVFSQVIYFLSNKIPRAQFLDMIAQFQSYGFFAKTSLAFILTRSLVIDREERRAQMRNLAKFELDPFLTKLLKS